MYQSRVWMGVWDWTCYSACSWLELCGYLRLPSMWTVRRVDEGRTLVASTFKGRLRKGAQEGDRQALRRVWRDPGEWGIKTSSAFHFSNSSTFFMFFPRPYIPKPPLHIMIPSLPLYFPPSFPSIDSTTHKKLGDLGHHDPPFLLALLHFVTLWGGGHLN